MLKLPLIAGLIFLFFSAQGQDKNKIELLGAKTLKFDKAIGVDAQRLIGDVRFRHKGALMYCDSAYLYNKSNSLDAFGNVRIVQGDTLTLTSDKLYYDGNTQYVKVRDQVDLKDKEMTLKTNTLDYDRRTGEAIFYDRGVITSLANDNKLIACEGIYNSSTEFFFFRDSVFLENPNYRVETDTLNYDNLNEIAYFKGPTFIYSEENTIYCENGWYDTQKDISQFNENAVIYNGHQKLMGDSIWYSRNEGLGRAYIDVSIQDTLDQYIINGDYGEYNEQTGKNLVTGRAEMIQYNELDSLFLHSDTLLAIRDTVLGNKVHAYPGVKFFKKDIQGAADSLVFSEADSLIEMYTDPVLWSQDLQITGDTILIKTFDGVVQNLYVFENAFMINELDTSKYNQIKGRRLTGYFSDNDLYKVLIKGNGESLYYASEETPDTTASEMQTDSMADLNNESDTLSSGVDEGEPPARDSTAVEGRAEIAAADTTVREKKMKVKYIGVNKSICSNILIYLSNNQVKRIVFLKKPNGKFHPMHKFPREEARFDGFIWEPDRRPASRRDIFL